MKIHPEPEINRHGTRILEANEISAAGNNVGGRRVDGEPLVPSESEPDVYQTTN